MHNPLNSNVDYNEITKIKQNIIKYNKQVKHKADNLNFY